MRPQEASDEEDETPLKKKLNQFGDMLAQVRCARAVHAAPALPRHHAFEAGGALMWRSVPAQRGVDLSGGPPRGANLAWRAGHADVPARTRCLRVRPLPVVTVASLSPVLAPQVIFWICVLVWLINFHNYLSYEPLPNAPFGLPLPDPSTIRVDVGRMVRARASPPRGAPAAAMRCPLVAFARGADAEP